jgi:L-asparaginase/Glu-tRNA(Gln) amidotransferase subunit D
MTALLTVAAHRTAIAVARHWALLGVALLEALVRLVHHLLEAGVVSGRDITPEAAMVKLMVLLGDPNLSSAEVRELLSQDLAGELTVG